MFPMSITTKKSVIFIRLKELTMIDINYPLHYASFFEVSVH